MSDESRFMALRCTAEHGEHPLDEHGRITLADPDGDIWAWPSEYVAPWLSVEDVEAIGWLDEAVRDLLTNRGNRFTVQNALRQRYHALASLRARMGWK